MARIEREIISAVMRDENGYVIIGEPIAELVRCKDCKWHEGVFCFNGRTKYAVVNDDYFCADGERSADWIRNPKYPHGELRDHLIDEMLDKEERDGIQ